LAAAALRHTEESASLICGDRRLARMEEMEQCIRAQQGAEFEASNLVSYDFQPTFDAID